MKCLAFGRCTDDKTAKSMRDRLIKVHTSKHGPFHLAIAFASNSSIFQHIEEAYPIPIYGTSFLDRDIYFYISHSLTHLFIHILFLTHTFWVILNISNKHIIHSFSSLLLNDSINSSSSPLQQSSATILPPKTLQKIWQRTTSTFSRDVVRWILPHFRTDSPSRTRRQSRPPPSFKTPIRKDTKVWTFCSRHNFRNEETRWETWPCDWNPDITSPHRALRPQSSRLTFLTWTLRTESWNRFTWLDMWIWLMFSTRQTRTRPRNGFTPWVFRRWRRIPRIYWKYPKVPRRVRIFNPNDPDGPRSVQRKLLKRIRLHLNSSFNLTTTMVLKTITSEDVNNLDNLNV